jgi:hypothetical protein
VSIDKAFRVFTEDFGRFKPPEHNMLGVEIAETVFEPRVGGHLYDRGIDGSECRWARILAFEPPTRVVFSWDLREGSSRVRTPGLPLAGEIGAQRQSPVARSVNKWHSGDLSHGGWCGECA